MGMAMIQCQNHKVQDINGACKCVIVKVIIPVAVTAVSNCSINVGILVYILEMGLHDEKMAAQKFLILEYTRVWSFYTSAMVAVL